MQAGQGSVVNKGGRGRCVAPCVSGCARDTSSRMVGAEVACTPASCLLRPAAGEQGLKCPCPCSLHLVRATRVVVHVSKHGHVPAGGGRRARGGGRSPQGSWQTTGLRSAPGDGGARCPDPRSAPVRPVQLYQVYVVGAQAAQAAVDGLRDVSHVQALGPTADPGHLPRRARHLGAHQDLVPAGATGQAGTLFERAGGRSTACWPAHAPRTAAWALQGRCTCQRLAAAGA